MMITIVARVLLKEGKKQEFIASVQEMIEGSRAEDGNIFYDLYEDADNEHAVAFIEKWKDKEAIEFHNRTPHFLAGLKVLKELSEDIQIVKYRPAV